MKKRLVNLFWLALWIMCSVFIAGIFLPVTPPGGIEWPYYIGFVLILIGSLVAADKIEKVAVALCYGIVGGYILALPVFFPEWHYCCWLAGGDAEARTRFIETTILKIMGCSLLLGVLSAALFSVARKWRKKQHSEPSDAPAS